MAVLVINTVFQIIAAFNNWMTVIDENNHYTHGPLYGFYIGIYVVVIALTAAEFLVFSLSYRKRNRASLISVFILVIAGIAMQEVLGSEYRTAYVALTIAVALMFIHYAEFYKMAADEHIQNQRKQLMKDALCGVFSRYAYEKDIEKYSRAKQLSPNFTAFVFDINGLKAVNDTIGHDAGDELITGAAKCIEKVKGNFGRCYRTGGDEFVVLANMERERVKNIPVRLRKEAEKWSGGRQNLILNIASGYARKEDYQDYTVEELVKKADKAMYASKAEFYLNSDLSAK
jgi:diguanylate cyclase (GGDEF)-like protein